VPLGPLPRRALAVAAGSLLLAACGGGTTPPRAEDERPGTAETAPPSEVRGPRRAPPSAICAGGWRRPSPGSPLFERPLEVIARTMRLEDPIEVTDMRYFRGPESPPSKKEYLAVVDRWYVKGFLSSDPSVRGRWLVEKREWGSGVAAVAPFDSEGFRSPDWVGFQYKEGEARSYPGLPGRWEGVAYDFVMGGKGLTIAGLGPAARGCLSGT
jgi:hypothetical protein